MSHPATPMDAVPSLDTGLNLLETPEHRSTALHQLALQSSNAGEPIRWIDARNNASSHLLKHPGSRREFANIRVARAFTAFQHHELVRTLPQRANPDTPLVVVPCLTSLYLDDDVPSPEDRRYLESSAAILAETADVLDIPILASTVKGSRYRDLVSDYTSKEITVEDTELGYRFEAPGFETLIYREDGYWQTTIPYWVNLYGAVDDVDPAEYMVEEGLVAATV